MKALLALSWGFPWGRRHALRPLAATWTAKGESADIDILSLLALSLAANSGESTSMAGGSRMETRLKFGITMFLSVSIDVMRLFQVFIFLQFTLHVSHVLWLDFRHVAHGSHVSVYFDGHPCQFQACFFDR